MIYHIREQFWSFGDTFDITDQAGNRIFQVVGKAFSWGNDLSFQSAVGVELARIKQKLMTMMPRYQILVDGSVFAEVKKEFTWFKQKFELDVPGPNDYSIEGSFWRHDYRFKRRSGIVATVSKDLWGWTDSYGVEIADGEDAVAILSVCIVLDQVLHDGKD
jgi:uncharacterized protein YxjI